MKGEFIMSVKIIIKRKFPKDQEKELFKCIRSIRKLVPVQSGYISGEYLRSIEDSNEILTISTWFSHEDWIAWFNSDQRKEIQSKIDTIDGVISEHTVYRYIKTR
jgi:heme-degrading monooxygenase HmoA